MGFNKLHLSGNNSKSDPYPSVGIKKERNDVVLHWEVEVLQKKTSTMLVQASEETAGLGS